MGENETKSFREPAKTIPVRVEVDVAVVGAGPTGIMAALAAAGDGLKVALIESRSFVGGNLTIGLPVLGFLSQKGKPIMAGLIAGEVLAGVVPVIVGTIYYFVTGDRPVNCSLVL